MLLLEAIFPSRSGGKRRDEVELWRMPSDEFAGQGEEIYRQVQGRAVIRASDEWEGADTVLTGGSGGGMVRGGYSSNSL